MGKSVGGNFMVPNSIQGCDGWGEGRGIVYQSFGGPVERYAPLATPRLEFGLKRSILFLEISRGFLCIFRRKDQRRCDGWAAWLI